ncbi:hypothetical protein SELMODRAFT_160095 [Selaginella moellendorffii]|uniref:Peptidyl-prolyl cis-trans isomerase n=1 Tax=Selaginella moellendorffii TaxID=88036 RepID=D8T167_SELML|nr:peptidyl-prolyl cis-trans isomerase CYP28, chloroplastic [Selaginella moellendorffii]EFJ09586.1 hypothetical protein SELMODRAFT_160095 [Selaginella moellendorffii]|eukprot:XP_002989312.1 peptidyl-prolyl cis-trans isomerase CYP28, chloroplastic [Selaginella moellendorffii]
MVILSPPSCCDYQCGRRIALLAATAAAASSTLAASATPSIDLVDTSITDRVFFNLGLCQSSNTPAGGRPACSDSDSQPLGRVVIGLYGNQVPHTTRLIKAMATGAAGSSYQGTVFHKVIQGRYIQAGHQGSKEKGEVSPPSPDYLESNPDTVSPRSFLLRHSRPGTVSLCLAENDDDESIRLNPDYRNVQFMITTGPGPAPDLDNRNIVFGTVLQGIDIVASIAAMPTFKPSDRVREFNNIAQILGDVRASNARSSWYRPVKPVLITSCGEELQ